jgi:site-specific recombinase XerD
MGCLARYLRSFDRVLRGENKSPCTREIYLGRAARLDAWLEKLPDSYLQAVIARTSASTGSNHYRALQQFFKFLAREEVIDWDPFSKLDPVRVEEKPVPVIRRPAQLKLVAACSGSGGTELRRGRREERRRLRLRRLACDR